MPVNQGGSALWSPPPFGMVSLHHSAGFGSTHSPTLLTGFVGECCFVGEFGVSLEIAFSMQIGRRHIGFFPEPHTPFTMFVMVLVILSR